MTRKATYLRIKDVKLKRQKNEFIAYQ